MVTLIHFLNKRLSDYFCIPPEIKNLTLEGAFDQEIFKTIRFTVSICKNETGKVSCLPEEEIREKMARGYIGVYFVDYAVNSEDYLNPKKPQPKEIFTNFVLDSKKVLDINLKNSFLETDDGLVFEEKQEEKLLMFEGLRSSISGLTTRTFSGCISK